MHASLHGLESLTPTGTLDAKYAQDLNQEINLTPLSWPECEPEERD